MVKKAIEEGLIAGMGVVWDKYERGDFFLPDMVIAATVMKEGLKVLSPLLKQRGIESSGTVVLGTAKGTKMFTESLVAKILPLCGL